MQRGGLRGSCRWPGRVSNIRKKRGGASYVHEWNRFVAWSEAAGRRSLPAAPEDIVAYLKNRAEAGAKASTIKVVAAAIAHNHKDAGYDVPLFARSRQNRPGRP